MVIYPEGIWYGWVRKEDVPEIVERTIIGGQVIRRLLIQDDRYRPKAESFDPLTLPALPAK